MSSLKTWMPFLLFSKPNIFSMVARSLQSVSAKNILSQSQKLIFSSGTYWSIFIFLKKKIFPDQILNISILLHSITAWIWVEAAENACWDLENKKEDILFWNKENRSSTDHDVCYGSTCSLFYSALPHTGRYHPSPPPHTYGQHLYCKNGLTVIEKCGYGYVIYV
jgi:hypothetical protein